MTSATIVESRTTAEYPSADGGAIPASSLHFQTGHNKEAIAMVEKYHYSHRCSRALVLVGSLHQDGGLLGNTGEMVAAALWTVPSARMLSGNILELHRLVRSDDKVPLSFLISQCVRELKRRKFDLLVSYADGTQGHLGYVYQASNWNYACMREPSLDGFMIDGIFVPRRTCYSKWGTSSFGGLKLKIPDSAIEQHMDKGKYLYWMSLGKRGNDLASKYRLQRNPYPKTLIND